MITFTVLLQHVPSNMKVGLSFFSIIGASLSSNLFMIINVQGQGITWSNLTMEIQNYTVAASLYMYAINILFFGLLGLYLDQSKPSPYIITLSVIPTGYSNVKHPLFLFDSCRSRKK